MFYSELFVFHKTFSQNHFRFSQMFYRIESEGEGYNPSDSDTYFGSIILQKKIGGPLEYFGLKKIKKSTKE